MTDKNTKLAVSTMVQEMARQIMVRAPNIDAITLAEGLGHGLGSVMASMTKGSGGGLTTYTNLRPAFIDGYNEAKDYMAQMASQTKKVPMQ